MIETQHPLLSINRQCALLNFSRSSYYYEQASESEINLALMRVTDEEYTQHPVYGRRRMTAYLQRQGFQINVKRTRRLMQLMGLEAIYPKPNLSEDILSIQFIHICCEITLSISHVKYGL